jgi:hypothetical protein
VIPPAEVEMSRAGFLRVARSMFDADAETFEQLYPMVRDLRGMAARVSQIAMNDDALLSETATGE